MSRHRVPFDPGFVPGLPGERLPLEQALALLPEGERIAVLYPGGIPPVAWLRCQVVQILREHGAKRAQEEMRQRGFGLAVEDPHGVLWIATRGEGGPS